MYFGVQQITISVIYLYSEQTYYYLQSIIHIIIIVNLIIISHRTGYNLRYISFFYIYIYIYIYISIKLYLNFEVRDYADKLVEYSQHTGCDYITKLLYVYVYVKEFRYVIASCMLAIL